MYVIMPMVMPTDTRTSALIPTAEPTVSLPNLTASAITTPAMVMRSTSMARLPMRIDWLFDAREIIAIIALTT